MNKIIVWVCLVVLFTGCATPSNQISSVKNEKKLESKIYEDYKKLVLDSGEHETKSVIQNQIVPISEINKKESFDSIESTDKTFPHSQFLKEDVTQKENLNKDPSSVLQSHEPRDPIVVNESLELINEGVSPISEELSIDFKDSNLKTFFKSKEENIIEAHSNQLEYPKAMPIEQTKDAKSIENSSVLIPEINEGKKVEIFFSSEEGKPTEENLRENVESTLKGTPLNGSKKSVYQVSSFKGEGNESSSVQTDKNYSKKENINETPSNQIELSKAIGIEQNWNVKSIKNSSVLIPEINEGKKVEIFFSSDESKPSEGILRENVESTLKSTPLIEKKRSSYQVSSAQTKDISFLDKNNLKENDSDLTLAPVNISFKSGNDEKFSKMDESKNVQISYNESVNYKVVDKQNNLSNRVALSSSSDKKGTSLKRVSKINSNFDFSIKNQVDYEKIKSFLNRNRPIEALSEERKRDENKFSLSQDYLNTISKGNQSSLLSDDTKTNESRFFKTLEWIESRGRVKGTKNKE